MQQLDIPDLLMAGTLDPRSLALLWLLLEDGVPLVVAGPAERSSRAAVASALLGLDPARDWVIIDTDDEVLTTERLAALLQGGPALAITVSAADLAGVLEALTAMGLPRDGVRRLSLVVILERSDKGLRCTVMHYLRPLELDAQRHLQRRPPAVLAAWDEREDVFEDYAWAITPELADRIDRSQADLEERVSARARFLASLPAGEEPSRLAQLVTAYLAGEPERERAPEHEPARPSPFGGGLLDADEHGH